MEGVSARQTGGPVQVRESGPPIGAHPANITAEKVLPGDAQGSLVVENSTIEESENHCITCNDAGIDLTAQGITFAGIPGEDITRCGTE